MKPPIQTFDVERMVRFRVRGTHDQICLVHEMLYQIAIEAGRGEHRFSTFMGSSGPASGDETVKQWAMAFYASAALTERLRELLQAIGLKEET